MKKTLLLGVFSVLSISFGYSQTEKAWKSFDGKEVKIAKTAERGTFPASYKLMQLELKVTPPSFWWIVLLPIKMQRIF